MQPVPQTIFRQRIELNPEPKNKMESRLLFYLIYFLSWPPALINGLAHHNSELFEITNMPHEILHFCQSNAKRFLVTTTLDRENKQVIELSFIFFGLLRYYCLRHGISTLIFVHHHIDFRIDEKFDRSNKA